MDESDSEDSITAARPKSGRAAKLQSACARCHQLKTKCRLGPGAGGVPCLRCDEGGYPCLPQPAPPPRARPSVILKEHERQINELRLAIESLVAKHTILESRFAQSESIPKTLSPEPRDISQTSNPVSGVSDATEPRADLRNPVASDIIRENRLLPNDSDAHNRYKRKRDDSLPHLEPSEESQQLAFDMFTRYCALSVNFFDVNSTDHTRQNILAKSAILYWTIIAVGCKESKDLSSTFEYALRIMAKGVRMTLGGSAPTLHDFMACVISMLWLSPVRPPGHIVAMAYELDLHESGRVLVSASGLPDQNADRFRLWCQVVLFDILCSLASARPRLIQDSDLTNQAQLLLTLPDARFQDCKAVSQVELLSAAYGWQTESRQRETSLLADAAATSAFFDVHNDFIDIWLAKWLPWAESLPSDPNVFSAPASVKAGAWFAKMYLAFPLLRGVGQTQDLSLSRHVALSKAVEATQGLLRVALEYYQPPVINYVTEVTNVNFALAASFLLKVVHLLPGNFDDSGIIDLVDQSVGLFAHISGQYYSRLIGKMVSNVKAGMMEPMGSNVDLGVTDISQWAFDTDWSQGLLESFLSFPE